MNTAEDQLDALEVFQKRMTNDFKKLTEANDRGHSELNDLIEQLKLKMNQSFKKLDGTHSNMGARQSNNDLRGVTSSSKQADSTSPLPRVSPSGMNSGLAQSDSRGKRLEGKIDELRTNVLPKMVDEAE